MVPLNASTMKFEQSLPSKRYNFGPGIVQNPTERIAKRNYLDLTSGRRTDSEQRQTHFYPPFCSPRDN
jgi:hypothetical protein